MGGQGILGSVLLPGCSLLATCVSPAPVCMGTCHALWRDVPGSMAALVPGACGALVPTPVVDWVPAPAHASVCIPHLFLVDWVAVGPFRTWSTASARSALVRETGRS